MDFERADIKALFYDYPIETFMQMLDNEQNMKKDEYLDILPLLMRWRDTNFTQTEDKLITDQLETSWDEDKNIPKEIGNIYRPFLLVGQMAQELLCTHHEEGRIEPRVRFENLFRWKDTTLFVGEDLLTMAYIAQCDIARNTESDLFLWPDTAHHNKEGLNVILNRGLTDIHAHYNATADIFHFNWINMVNSVRHKSAVSKIKHNQDLSVQDPTTKQNYSLKCICMAAAYLRMLFYKDFVLDDEGEKVSFVDYTDVKRLLIDEPYVLARQKDIQHAINALRMEGVKMVDGSSFDYALRMSFGVVENINNINLAYQGERLILYTFFSKYFCGCPKAIQLAPYFYLYILLKTRIRKEIVQINQFNGFENFEDYQNRKELFIDKDDPLGKLWGRVVLHSTIGKKSKDYLEARITPKDIDVCFKNFKEGLFTKKNVCPSPSKHFGLVVHFIKKKEMPDEENGELTCRYFAYRKELHNYIEEVVKNRQSQKDKNCISIYGIDAAGTEMYCRPEVFGHVYRYAKRKNIFGRTYHVGEDFFDLVDGLRAVDEAIEYLELDNNSRIGHGLALCVDANRYYKNRRLNIIMPKQNMLDCCVWLWIRCKEFNIPIVGDLDFFVQTEARKLYKEIGYTHGFDMWSYWQSMQMRGFEPNFNQNANVAKSDWAETAVQKLPFNPKDNEEASLLFHQYHYEGKVKSKGKERYSAQWRESIVDAVSKLQEMMIRKVEQRGIAIECNPTSNIKIGFFDRYDEHPLVTKFFPIDKWKDPQYPLLKCSINTDDRGVFATSVYNEYSLIALALLKKKNEKTGKLLYNEHSVFEYIEEVRKQSERQRFAGTDGKEKTTDASCTNLKPLVWSDNYDFDKPSSESEGVEVNVQLVRPSEEPAIKIVAPVVIQHEEDKTKIWCIQYGVDGFDWEVRWFERKNDFSPEWVIEDFVMQPENRLFWVGPRTFKDYSKVENLSEIKIAELDDQWHRIGAGAVGTLRIYDDTNKPNWSIEFIPKCCQLTYGIEGGVPWENIELKGDVKDIFGRKEETCMKQNKEFEGCWSYIGFQRKDGTTAFIKGLSEIY